MLKTEVFDIACNAVFKNLLKEFQLSASFDVDEALPIELQKLVDADIVVSDFGITLKSLDKLYKAAAFENQSIVEDNENHFHITDFIVDENDKRAFSLSVTTLFKLADRFNSAGVKDVRLWLSFQTPELSIAQDQSIGLYNSSETRYISDRISFYTRRPGEDIISADAINNTLFEAILIIDL